MARLVDACLAELLGGAVILGVNLYRTWLGPASAAAQSADVQWQLAAYPPREAPDSILEDLPNLPADCDVELPAMVNGTVLLLHACP